MDCPHVALDPEIDGIATDVMGVAGSAHVGVVPYAPAS